MTAQPASHQPATTTADTDPAGLFWIDRLAARTPSRLIQADLYVRAAGDVTGHRVNMAPWVEVIGRHRPKAEPADILLTLVATYLARTSGSTEVTLGYVGAEALSRHPLGANQPLPWKPLHVTISGGRTFGDALAEVEGERRMLAAAPGPPPALLDHPDLAAARDCWSLPLPIALAVADKVPADHLPGQINLVIAADGRQLEIWLSPALEPELAERVGAHVATLAELRDLTA